MNQSTAALWIDLGSAVDLPGSQIGNKTARLAQLRRAGFLVPDGWVLPVDQADSEPLHEAAKQLVALRPSTSAWILRSSSPWEDREGASAAGLFTSVTAGPSILELREAMKRVRASRSDAHVVELLGENAPLAVLAQPLLQLDAWSTVELRAGREPSLDGWSVEGAPELPSELLDSLRAFFDEGAILAELGRSGGEWFVLQCRPAPKQELPLQPLSPSAPVLVDESLWRWDREHSARPLCPLLAGYFEAWLSAQDDPPSRLFHGCWHDRATAGGGRWNEQARARLLDVSALEAQLQKLESLARADHWEPDSWRGFVGGWLRFQSEYFHRPTGAARAWLRRQPSAAAARGDSYVARSMALDELAARMREGEQVELGEFLEQHGHQSDWPWDGRGRCWSEDATPLRSELARRSAQEPVPRTMATEASDASLVAAALEEDDELLTRSYALFRVALRAAARCSGVPAARWEDCLELTPSAWEQLLEAFDLSVWQEQVRIGRETARRWLGQALLRGEQGGHELTGTAVVAGRLTAPVRVLPSAGADGGPDWGEILVVPSIQPADAVVFPRLAGLIVEAGDLLGHAAVLAREAGVPCVVGVRGACARLAATGRATLDATAGVVRPDD